MMSEVYYLAPFRVELQVVKPLSFSMKLTVSNSVLPCMIQSSGPFCFGAVLHKGHGDLAPLITFAFIVYVSKELSK